MTWSSPPRLRRGVGFAENPSLFWFAVIIPRSPNHGSRVQSRGKVALLHSCTLDLITHRPTIAPFQKIKDLKKECTKTSFKGARMQPCNVALLNFASFGWVRRPSRFAPERRGVGFADYNASFTLWRSDIDASVVPHSLHGIGQFGGNDIHQPPALL